MVNKELDIHNNLGKRVYLMASEDIVLPQIRMH